jgi:hypothetical protein
MIRGMSVVLIAMGRHMGVGRLSVRILYLSHIFTVQNNESKSGHYKVV